jgi:hypothetical protein
MKYFILLTLILILSTSIALASSVYGGTNFGYSGYPDHSCRKPYDRTNTYARQSYVKCINDYIENANNDVKRINEAQQEAISEAKKYLEGGY